MVIESFIMSCLTKIKSGPKGKTLLSRIILMQTIFCQHVRTSFSCGSKPTAWHLLNAMPMSKDANLLREANAINITLSWLQYIFNGKQYT